MHLSWSFLHFPICKTVWSFVCVLSCNGKILSKACWILLQASRKAFLAKNDVDNISEWLLDFRFVIIWCKRITLFCLRYSFIYVFEGTSCGARNFCLTALISNSPVTVAHWVVQLSVVGYKWTNTSMKNTSKEKHVNFFPSRFIATMYFHIQLVEYKPLLACLFGWTTQALLKAFI